MGENIKRKIRLLHLAFKRHIKQHHNADFEVCHNSVCKLMYGIERKLYEDEVFPFQR